jgi:hypothetical protein
MAELTQLESKLAEVMGLAQAAQESTRKVIRLVDDREVKDTLTRMRDEASETEERCKALAADIAGKKSALQRKAKETRTEAQEMMKTYLGGDADGLDGLEFMMMAEAGELGHVEIVRRMNRRARNERVRELVDWALPIQQRHVKETTKAALKLADEEVPGSTG